MKTRRRTLRVFLLSELLFPSAEGKLRPQIALNPLFFNGNLTNLQHGH